MYSESFEFEGDLLRVVGDVNDFERATQTKEVLMGGKIQELTAPLRRKLNLFMSSVLEFELSTIEDAGSETVYQKLVNNVRRGLFYVENNVFNDLLDQNMELETAFFDKSQQTLLLRLGLNIVLFIAEILFLMVFIGSMLPIMNRINNLSRTLFSFLLSTENAELEMIITRTNRFV